MCGSPHHAARHRQFRMAARKSKLGPDFWGNFYRLDTDKYTEKFRAEWPPSVGGGRPRVIFLERVTVLCVPFLAGDTVT